MNGVCDLIVHQGDNGTLPLFNQCNSEMPGVTQYSHYLPKETPLVGLHGIQIEDGILSLGLILLDTLDPQCQKPLEAPAIGGVDVVSKYLIDEAI